MFKTTGMIAVLAVLVVPSPLSFGQGGCTVIHTWDLSGGAACTPQRPPDANWIANELGLQARFGGIGPSCGEYIFMPNPDNPSEGCWEGDCYSIGYECTTESTPPAASAPETAPGPSCPSCGHPIHLASGNTYIPQTDLTIPGLGGGLKLVRSWNSFWPPSQAAFSAGLFGNNWRSTYEERVFSGNDGTMKYSRADGSFWSFILIYGNPSYQVVAPANGKATLTEQSTTTWTITFQNGEQRIFDYTSGLLLDIIDRNGNTTALTYDGGNRLVTVTDPASRHLYFSYTSPSSYLISAVTSDVGVSLSYAYDSQSRLTTVTEPDQTTISFTYDSNSFITAVKDQMGKILESHTYDSTGRGLTSSRANGVESVTVSYGNQ